MTDIEGSTRLWDRYPAEMSVALARHDAAVAQFVVEHHGQVVKQAGGGDSVLAVFRSAPDAIAAALAIQRWLHTEAWPTPTPLRARLALHAGQAEPRDEDYFGGAVNRCARLVGIAHGGQTVLSRSVVELARESLPSDVTLRPRGLHRLRDLQRPEDVFELLCPDLPAGFPPLRSLNVVPHNLPFRLDSFVGRRAESQMVHDLVSRNRLVTVTGPGGVGKSRLALHVAADSVGEFEHGLWWVDLARLDSGGAVPAAVAAVLEVRSVPGRPWLDVLAEHIADQHVLIVLDNAEHLREACANLVEPLLGHCPELHVLITSRESLRVPGEQAWILPPLTVTGDSPRGAGGQTPGAEAVQLFVERARLAQPRFELTPATASEVAEICRQLDGLPLAIELAAGRLDVLTPAEILARLADRFRLLVADDFADPRLRSLRAAVDLSVDTLTGPEERLFNRLAVLAADFDLAAAEDIAAGDDVPVAEVVDLLQQLIRKSLVVRGEDQLGHARYQMLETLRQYGRQRLAATPDLAVTCRRMARHFAALAAAADARLSRSNDADALRRITGEYDNLRAALRWAVSAPDTQLALRLAGSLGRYWYVKGYFAEGREWLAEALRLPEPLAVAPATRAKALQAAGNMAFGLGDIADARGHYEASLALYDQDHDPAGVARALHNLAMLCQQQSRFGEARALFEQSLAIKRGLGDLTGAANTLNNLGLLRLWEDDFSGAESCFAESLAIARQVGDGRLAAQVLLHSAGIAHTRCELARAETLAEASLNAYRELEARHGIVLALNVLAMLDRENGRAEQARARLRESRDLARAIDYRWGLAEVLETAAELEADDGNWAAAETALRSSLVIAEEIGDRQFEADLMGIQARIALSRGAIERAARLHHGSLTIRREICGGRSLDSCISMEDILGVLVRVGLAEGGVLLVGAAEAFRQRCGAPPQPTAQLRLEGNLERARAALGARLVERVRATGHDLPLDEAGQRALCLLAEIGGLAGDEAAMPGSVRDDATHFQREEQHGK